MLEIHYNVSLAVFMGHWYLPLFFLLIIHPLRLRQNDRHLADDNFKGISLSWFVPNFTEFLALTKQLYDWFSPSVCLFFSLPVCPAHLLTMFLSTYHHFFVITIDRSDIHAKDKCQRSKAKVNPNFAPIWHLPDRNSNFNCHMATEWCTKLQMVLKRCSIMFQYNLSNFKVTLVKKIDDVDPI